MSKPFSQLESKVRFEPCIVKSRRKDGQPYYLQRGIWTTQGSKRTFDSNWEKGFDTREAAEKHQAWVVEMAAQSADVSN